MLHGRVSVLNLWGSALAASSAWEVHLVQSVARIPVAGASSVASGAIDALASSALRLATIVQACSRRRDVRELRARILLLLLRLRCPVRSRPARSWYVPGAVARLGVEGLRRGWRGFYGEEPPSERTLRAHLSLLERAAAIVRSPGERIPTRSSELPLRWPDTIHVLDDARDAAFWTGEGADALARNPKARSSLVVWLRLFRGWRQRARSEPRLDFPEPHSPAQGRDAGEASRALVAIADDAGPLEVLAALREAGAAVAGRSSFEVARDPRRLVEAARMLGRELGRGTRIRNRAGWLVWAVRWLRGGTIQ